jgi:hypothetical protein
MSGIRRNRFGREVVRKKVNHGSDVPDQFYCGAIIAIGIGVNDVNMN